jgi:hypothetical protein
MLIPGHIPGLFRPPFVAAAVSVGALGFPPSSAFRSGLCPVASQTWANPARVALARDGSGRTGLRRTQNFSTGTFPWSLIST